MGLENLIVQMAVAERDVTSFDDMETMCAEPLEVRWVSFSAVAAEVDCGILEEDEDEEYRRAWCCEKAFGRGRSGTR